MFSHLLDFLDRNDFNYLARKYEGDKYVKQFTCYNQLATLMFGQLSGRESLRDVVLATQAHATKATHLGFGKFVTRSNLSNANNNRDCRIFEEFAYQVIAEARKCRATDIFKLGDNVYMPLIQRLSSFAWKHSNGPSTGRTSGKAVSKYIPCTTLRHQSRRSSTLQRRESTT